MMPMETTCSIPTEESSLENIVIPNEDQTQMCLLPSNFDRHTPSKQYRRRYPHISSALNHEYIAPFRSQWGINNKMIPVGYYLQSGQCVNENDANNYPIIPFSFALNPSLVSVESNTSIPNCNQINSTQKIDYENHIQSYPITNQQHRYGQPYPLPTTSSISTSVNSSTKAKRSKRIYRSQNILDNHSLYNLEHARKVRQLSTGQPLPPYSRNPIISNYWPSLPLPSMTNVLTRSNERTFPMDLIRTSNFVPLSLSDLPISSNSPSTTVQQHLLPHQTVGQCSLDHRCNHAQKPFNLSDNLPYHLNRPYEHYYMPRSNPMSMNIPTMQYSTLLPQFNTTFSSRSLSNNTNEFRQERIDSQKSETIENPLVEVSKMPKLNRHGQKKSNIEDHRTRTLIKRMKQKSKLAILKFMIHKRKKQISKKKFLEEDVSKSNDLIASSLKITFNATQKIECISLYYHHRPKPQIKTDDSLIASNTIENRLDLLIEAANFVEMNKDSSKLARESFD
jgi:hypothetical protein